MFVQAIEEVGNFTRPVYTISRLFGDKNIIPGAATFFFVNDDGVAVTCKHVVELIAGRQSLNDHYAKFVSERNLLAGKADRKATLKLQSKYNFQKDSTIQLNEMFIGVTTDEQLRYRWINHPKYDLSIIFFEGLKNRAYQSHAVFLKDSSILKQGKRLCRLGYPFPEFSNYRYNEPSDSIEWTKSGKIETPRFPMDGIITRHLGDGARIVGLEISTPGLRGQSGGPLFDERGIICGIQSSTNHLHLGFDMKDYAFQAGGKTILVNNQPFLHVGHCVHVDIIKEFLSANGVK